MITVNGRRYPLWSQFVEDPRWRGGRLQDAGDSMDRAMGLSNDWPETKIVEIKLSPNGNDSAWFCVEGEDFSWTADFIIPKGRRHGGTHR